MKVRTTLVGLLMIMSSGVAMAHPGHDHGHWSALLIHLLWAAPIIALPAFFFWKSKKTSAESDERL